MVVVKILKREIEIENPKKYDKTGKQLNPLRPNSDLSETSISRVYQLVGS